MRAILTLFMIAMLAEPALAQAVTHVDTELVKGRCRFIDDDGEVGDYALKRCPGLAGARVFTVAAVSHVSLSFRGKVKAENVVSGYSLGDKLEWRGIKSKQGFEPYAVIVRVIQRDPDKLTDEKEPEKRFNVLAVLRVEPRIACLMAVADETENKNALVLARAAADAEARRFVCGTHKAKMLGLPSRWAQDVLGYDGEPPK